MNKGLKVVLTLVLIPVSFVLGLALCAALPSSPGLVGLLVGGLMAAAVGLSLPSAVLLALSFGAGSCILLEAAMEGWFALGLWLTALLLIVTVGLYVLLRRKEKFSTVMLYGFVGIFVYCALSAILYTRLRGDLVDAAVAAFSSMMDRMAAGNGELVNLILSTLSVTGVLDDVGLTAPTMELLDSTYAILLGGMKETLEASLRFSLLNMLTGLSLHGALWGTLLALFSAGKEREKYSELPDLKMVRVHPRASAILMLSALVLSFLTLVSDKGYALYLAVWTAVKFLFALQGLSVAEWFLEKKHWNVFWRRALILLLFLLLPGAWFLLGFIDQLFDFRGTRPRIMIRVQKDDDFNQHNEDDDKEDK